jgi:tetratricopeptide (TPR) repeat protein
MIKRLLGWLGLSGDAGKLRAAVSRVQAAGRRVDEAVKHSDHDMAQRVLEDALSVAQAGGVTWELAALNMMLGYMALHRRDASRAEFSLEAAIMQASQGGYEEIVAGARLGQVHVASLRQRFAEAYMLGFEVVEQYRQRRDSVGEHSALLTIAYLAQTRGIYDEGRLLAQQCLDYYRKSGSQVETAQALAALAAASAGEGDLESARSHYREALSLARQTGNKDTVAGILLSFGFCAQPNGEYNEQEDCLTEALALFRESGNTLHSAYALNNLGNLARYKGDYGRAADLYRESLRIKARYEDEWAISYTLEGCAGVAAVSGHADRTATLMAAAEAIRNRLGTPREAFLEVDCEQIAMSSRTALGEEAYGTTRNHGARLTWQQAVEFALAEVS